MPFLGSDGRRIGFPDSLGVMWGFRGVGLRFQNSPLIKVTKKPSIRMSIPSVKPEYDSQIKFVDSQKQSKYQKFRASALAINSNPDYVAFFSQGKIICTQNSSEVWSIDNQDADALHFFQGISKFYLVALSLSKKCINLIDMNRGTTSFSVSYPLLDASSEPILTSSKQFPDVLFCLNDNILMFLNFSNSYIVPQVISKDVSSFAISSDGHGIILASSQVFVFDFGSMTVPSLFLSLPFAGSMVCSVANNFFLVFSAELSVIRVAVCNALNSSIVSDFVLDFPLPFPADEQSLICESTPELQYAIISSSCSPLAYAIEVINQDSIRILFPDDPYAIFTGFDEPNKPSKIESIQISSTLPAIGKSIAIVAISLQGSAIFKEFSVDKEIPAVKMQTQAKIEAKTSMKSLPIPKEQELPQKIQIPKDTSHPDIPLIEYKGIQKFYEYATIAKTKKLPTTGSVFSFSSRYGLAAQYHSGSLKLLDLRSLIQQQQFDDGRNNVEAPKRDYVIWEIQYQKINAMAFVEPFKDIQLALLDDDSITFISVLNPLSAPKKVGFPREGRLQSSSIQYSIHIPDLVFILSCGSLYAVNLKTYEPKLIFSDVSYITISSTGQLVFASSEKVYTYQPFFSEPTLLCSLTRIPQKIVSVAGGIEVAFCALSDSSVTASAFEISNPQKMETRLLPDSKFEDSFKDPFIATSSIYYPFVIFHSNRKDNSSYQYIYVPSLESLSVIDVDDNTAIPIPQNSNYESSDCFGIEIIPFQGLHFDKDCKVCPAVSLLFEEDVTHFVAYKAASEEYGVQYDDMNLKDLPQALIPTYLHSSLDFIKISLSKRLEQVQQGVIQEAERPKDEKKRPAEAGPGRVSGFRWRLENRSRKL